MSELTWYSRLSILAGSLILVLQSVTRHGIPALTVLAVLAVSGGLVAFIAGLINDGRRQTVEHEDVHQGPPHEEEAIAVVPVTIEQRARDQEMPHHELDAAEPVRASDGSVRTYRVSEQAVPQECPACGLPVGTGQIAAVCSVCGTRHHAGCWIDRDFQCAVPDCTGSGSLEAPSRASAQTKASRGM